MLWRKIRQGRKKGSAGAGVVIHEISFAVLSTRELAKAWPRVVVTEMVKSGWNPDKFWYQEEENSRQRVLQMQRPWGRSEPGMLKKLQERPVWLELARVKEAMTLVLSVGRVQTT